MISTSGLLRIIQLAGTDLDYNEIVAELRAFNLNASGHIIDEAARAALELRRLVQEGTKR